MFKNIVVVALTIISFASIAGCTVSCDGYRRGLDAQLLGILYYADGTCRFVYKESNTADDTAPQRPTDEQGHELPDPDQGSLET